jgi:hypothetical protein
MKRLVWLLLLAVGTALAQVSPVESPGTKLAVCPCCEKSGDCGMPDCAMPPVAPTTPARPSATPAVTVSAKLAAPAPRRLREKFYVQFLPRAPLAPGLPASMAATSAASVFRFQEHGSLLI